MYPYKTFTLVTDNGPYITKLILQAPEEVRAECIHPDTFNVYVERIDPYTQKVFMASRYWMGPKIYPSKGYRPVTRAYPCDAQGNPVAASAAIALEMPYGPLHHLGHAQAPLQKNMNERVECRYRVTQIRDIPGNIPINGWVFDQFDGDLCPQVKGWQHGVSHHATVPMGYGWFTPELAHAKKNLAALDSHFGDEWAHALPEKLPLVIWLHGMGEGGTDPLVAYTGNKVVNISGNDIQRKLGGAAYVLAPQCPTFWMDPTGEVDADIRQPNKGISFYTEPLKALIDEFLTLHPDIDRDRIYIGGCSNGGFMTIRMLVSYPDFFAAAYPVCEAFRNSDLSDEDIASIRHIPIWFVQADNDPIVPAEACAVPTLLRLRAAGAPNAHMTLFERIVDTGGLFKDDQGRPYEYFGHASWIPCYNDECLQDLDGTRVLHNGRPVTLWQWMGRQRRG